MPHGHSSQQLVQLDLIPLEVPRTNGRIIGNINLQHIKQNVVLFTKSWKKSEMNEKKMVISKVIKLWLVCDLFERGSVENSWVLMMRPQRVWDLQKGHQSVSSVHTWAQSRWTPWCSFSLSAMILSVLKAHYDFYWADEVHLIIGIL